jgi:hypothetical protein
MVGKPPEVVMIHRGRRLAYLADNRTIPITNWIGVDGADCTPSEAIVCVAGTDEIGWFTIDLLTFEVPTLH